MPLSREEMQMARELMAGSLDDIGDVFDDGIGDDLDGIGEVDIVGDLDIVGAPTAPRKITTTQLNRTINKRAKAMAAVALARRGGAPSAVERDHDRPAYTRYLPIHRDGALNGGLVAGGDTQDVIGEPQAPFRPEAFFVADDLVDDYLIMAISIGSEDLFISKTGGVPASMFKTDGVLSKLKVRTGQTSMQFSVRARNRSADARPFYGAFAGWALP